MLMQCFLRVLGTNTANRVDRVQHSAQDNLIFLSRAPTPVSFLQAGDFTFPQGAPGGCGRCFVWKPCTIFQCTLAVSVRLGSALELLR